MPGVKDGGFCGLFELGRLRPERAGDRAFPGHPSPAHLPQGRILMAPVSLASIHGCGNLPLFCLGLQMVLFLSVPKRAFLWTTDATAPGRAAIGWPAYVAADGE